MTFPFLLIFFSYYIFNSLTVSHMYVGNFIPFQLLRACHFLPHFLHWNPISYMCLYLCDRWGHFMCLLKVSTEEEVCAQICVCIWNACQASVPYENIYIVLCAQILFSYFHHLPLQYSWVTLHSSLCTSPMGVQLQECVSLSPPKTSGSF